ncbi:baseplate wedge subunit [uncultured Caudovirales phage]|uniref:Baseplate wedge subunit n=1 Tax=uncultured Caudovirales phage TaxID=2100421 RepID=A0A6J5L041_9CAUD|nr:baseplate wedge subunit [uncultured Caudovirales phage]CAB5218924.1 baseplate wedge subunit [uncultured Caudovirales phage]
MTGSVFNLPFSINNLGQTSATNDPREYWKQRIVLVLATRFGERVMRPDFGSDLYTALFENEALAADIAQRTITIAFNTWLRELHLIEIVPSYDYTTGFMDIYVRYNLPTGEQDSVSINTAIFNRTGDLIQEIPNG